MSATYGAADSEAEGEADSDAESESEGEADSEGDASAELEAGSDGNDGSGTGVASGIRRDGTPMIESTITRAKMARMVKIHGRASRSSREGSAPR